MSIKDALYKPFEDIPSRVGRGGTYQYVRWQDVADRMNQVFGSRWSSNVVYQDIIGNNVIIRVSVCIKDPDTGELFCQEGFGGAVNDDRQEAGNPFKSAYSKALKDACKKWGVALFLDEEDSQINHSSSPPPGYQAKEYGTPAIDAPVVPTTNTPKVEVPSTSTSAPPVIPPACFGGTDNTQTETRRAPVPEPMTPPAGVSMAAPKTNINMGQKVPSIDNGGPILISDVQKVALNHILSIKGVDYETLVNEAFEQNGVNKSTIPGPDELTYEEAVFVVKYGNDKFRKR